VYLLDITLEPCTLLHLLALDEKAAMMPFSIKCLTDLESDPYIVLLQCHTSAAE
jgi:hypothetical protein